MLVVVAMVKAVEGKGGELEREFEKLVPKVLEEPGVITYVIHRSIDDPSKFLVYERYKDREAFDYHHSTPYLKAFYEAFNSIKDREPVIELYNEIAGRA